VGFRSKSQVAAQASQQLKIEQLKARGRLCRDRISETPQLTKGPMTDEQKRKFAALQDAWLAVREKYRRAESVPERDAVITEFVKRHIAETDTAVLEAFQHWQVRSAAEAT